MKMIDSLRSMVAALAIGPSVPKGGSKKPSGLKRKFWPERMKLRHNNGEPIVLGRRAMKRARLARKKARAKARIAAQRQRRCA